MDQEPPGTYQVCPVCGWEDDKVQFKNPDFSGGANSLSLNQAKEQYRKTMMRKTEQCKNTIGRVLVMCLCVVMTVSAMPLTASAASQSKEDMAAEVLHELNLMAGTDKGFQLHQKLTRVEAITMLIHMMGEDEAVKNGNYSHPFTDVPAWAQQFVGYAYEHGLTSGVGENLFGSTRDCTQAQYLTFILRSLGYSDARGEFTWDNPYALAKQAGLIENTTPLRRFSRGNMATISFNALTAEIVSFNEIEMTTEGAIGGLLPDSMGDESGSTTKKPIEFNVTTSESVEPEAKPMPKDTTAVETSNDVSDSADGNVILEEAVTDGGIVSIPKKILKDKLIKKGMFSQETYDQVMADYNVGPKQVKTVYLTFDDGPSTKVTPKILDTLKAEGVPATFFVLGSRVNANPEIVRRQYDEGHKIANHGYSHDYTYLYTSTDNLMSDLNRGNAAIDRALGFAYGNNVFRFPGGSHTRKAAFKNAVKNAGHVYYDWNSSGQDSASPKGATASEILNATIATIWGDRNNVIVLLHDTNAKGTTAQALPGIIKYFRDNGYEFRTL